jgi:hypothetical protein
MFEGGAPLNTAGFGSQICHGNLTRAASSSKWTIFSGRAPVTLSHV